ncbi:MAG: hypothetical protein M1826_005430 [Phylliscum demangeonii]|nr:MAG: hypothetical protein M1826_005430 [Phylliscum demangeonii]
MSAAKRLHESMNPSKVSLLDYNPFDILGLNPGDIDYPDRDALSKAYTRACRARVSNAPRAVRRARAQLLARPSPLDLEPARARRQQEGASRKEAGLLMAPAVVAVEADADNSGLGVLLGPYYPPGCGEHGPKDYYLLLREHGEPNRNLAVLPAVTLGSFRWSLEKHERANAVVAMLDRRGRYYRRIVHWTLAGEPLPAPARDLNWLPSLPRGSIDYLPRFRDRPELEVMAMVREELALLQGKVDAPDPIGREAV